MADNKQSMDARWDDFRGRVKEAAGALFDDKETKREGQIEQAGADVQEKMNRFLDDVTTKAKELVGRD